MNENGFTLVELMVTLSIAAILLTIAAPSYVSMSANNRSATETMKLLSAVNLTRSESVKRGVAVSICARALPRTNPETCAGDTNWASGWLVFTDASGTSGAFDGTDDLIKVWGELSGNGSLAGNVSYIQYQPTGLINSAASFSLSYPDCRGNHNRTINIGLTGRAAVRTSVCS